MVFKISISLMFSCMYMSTDLSLLGPGRSSPLKPPHTPDGKGLFQCFIAFHVSLMNVRSVH